RKNQIALSASPSAFWLARSSIAAVASRRADGVGHEFLDALRKLGQPAVEKVAGAVEDGELRIGGNAVSPAPSLADGHELVIRTVHDQPAAARKLELVGEPRHRQRDRDEDRGIHAVRDASCNARAE